MTRRTATLLITIIAMLVMRQSYLIAKVTQSEWNGCTGRTIHVTVTAGDECVPQQAVVFTPPSWVVVGYAPTHNSDDAWSDRVVARCHGPPGF